MRMKVVTRQYVNFTQLTLFIFVVVNNCVFVKSTLKRNGTVSPTAPTVSPTATTTGPSLIPTPTDIQQCDLPEVIINKITSTTGYFDDNWTENNYTVFEKGEIVQVQFHCRHKRIPIKWILDADFTTKGIEELADSSTFRKVKNFSDPSSYEYLAAYYLKIKDPESSSPFALICQSISGDESDLCGRQVVVASYQGKYYEVKVLTKFEQAVNPAAKEIANKLVGKKAVEVEIECPFHLILHYDQNYAAFKFGWSPSEGTKDTVVTTSAQSLENYLRFDKIIEEKCIKFQPVNIDKECGDFCTILEYPNHQFKPIAFSYALGDEKRVLKAFFDLEPSRNFYYSWETVDPANLIYMNIVNQTEIYRGQEITVICYTSPFLFSYGTQISWTIIEETEPSEFSSNLVDNLTTFGTMETKGSVQPSKEFLDENGIASLNLSCIAPIWNSTGWVTMSQLIPLKESSVPKITGEGEELDTETSVFIVLIFGVGESGELECKAEGVPPPQLELIPPKNNLNFTSNLTIVGNLSVLTVIFSKVEPSYEGFYNCVATSSVGQHYKIYDLQISLGFPYFLKIILICVGVATFIFILVAASLTYKFKTERQEFMRLTEEAVRKFQEGFKNTSSIEFDSNSEYKKFEVPISKWGIGGTLLGSGAFGVVQKGFVFTGINQKSTVAVKTVNSPKDIGDFENSLMELTIMSYLGEHENIVSLVAACTDNIHRRSLLIGVEYCANGDLLNYLQKRKSLFYTFTKDGRMSLDWLSGKGPYANVVNAANFSTVDLYKWSYQIANGMQYLESKKVLHADLAARNVLLTQDRIAKISDFGLSRQLMESNNYTKKTNSPLPWRWMALESLKFQKFSSQSDIWAYGVVLHEIFSLGAEPWPGLAWTLEFVKELEEGRRLSRPNYATDHMYNRIMLECWRNEPENRINFSTARDYFETAVIRLNSTEGKDDDYLSGI